MRQVYLPISMVSFYGNKYETYIGHMDCLGQVRARLFFFRLGVVCMGPTLPITGVRTPFISGKDPPRTSLPCKRSNMFCPNEVSPP